MNNALAIRKYVIAGIFAVACFTFVFRLFYMQVIDDQFKLDASNETYRHMTQYPPRGCVKDRNGKLLVTNEAAYDLMVVPSQVKDFDTNSFCADLGITKADFISGIKKAIILNTASHASVFMKEVTPEIYAAFEEKMYKYHGFYSEVRTVRKYPLNIAPHILGYLGEVSKELCKNNPKYREGDYVGMSGIEESYESDLAGKKGVRIMVVDASNKEVEDFKHGKFDTMPEPGSNLTCTLDANLQAYGEKLMHNKAGSIVAIDPSSGEVLALVSCPEYDPNLLVGSIRARNYSSLVLDTLDIPLFNRALMAQYPPGSTFKPIEALIGQQEGVLNEHTVYYCAGSYPGGKPKCDAHHGSLDLEPAIAKSCNTYFSYVFMSIMGNRKYPTMEEALDSWRKYVNSFGLGTRLDIDLPSALRGNVPTIEHYNRVFGRGHWRPFTIISLGIGQGEMEVTPLQLANEASIIANRGYYFMPHVIKSIGDKNEIQKKYTTKHYTLVDPKYFDVVVQGMSDVVSDGTAAASKIPGVTMCGKTGTAQNPNGRDNSLFIAFAPMDHPKIALCVVIERGGWGAEWAAPIASLMIEKYLNDTIKRKDIETRMLDGNTLHYLEEEKLHPSHTSSVKHPAQKPKKQTVTTMKQ